MADILPYEIESLPFAKANLINALNNVIGTSDIFRFNPFEVLDLPAVTEIYLNINGAVLKISVLSDDFLNDDDLLSDININSLPKEISAAAFELAFSREFGYLNEYGKAYVSVLSDIPEDFTSAYTLFCTVKHNDSYIPLKVEFPGDDAANTIVAMLKNMNRESNTEIVNSLSVNLAFDIGYVSLKTLDLSTLSCGDIIIPDVFLYESNLTYAKLLNQYLVFELQDGQGIFKGIKSDVKKELMKNMSENVETNSANNAESADDLNTGNVSINTDALNFDVAFEIDRKTLSYDEITSLKPGSVVNLSCSKKSPVTIKVNDKVVGTGRLVDLGDNIGVQVTELKS